MKFFPAVLFLFLAAAAPAVAQVQVGGGIRAGVFGYSEDELDDSRLFWGAHGRVRTMKYFAGELSVQKREDDFQIGNGEIKLETVPLQLSAIVYPLAAFPVSPYFVAGTGWYFLTVTVSGDLGLPYVTGEGSIDHTENAFHVGVGVEAFLGDHFSIGGDVRKVFLEFNTPLISYEIGAYFLNIGATFYF